jgi:hypothetical protein
MVITILSHLHNQPAQHTQLMPFSPDHSTRAFLPHNHPCTGLSTTTIPLNHLLSYSTFNTPISILPLPSLLLHFTTINTLLNHSFLRPRHSHSPPYYLTNNPHLPIKHSDQYTCYWYSCSESSLPRKLGLLEHENTHHLHKNIALQVILENPTNRKHSLAETHVKAGRRQGLGRRWAGATSACRIKLQG